MNARKFILLVFAIAVTANHLLAQRPKSICHAVYFNKDSLNQLKNCDTAINNVYFNALTNRIVVVYNNGTKAKLSPHDIFGYRTSENMFFRIVNDDKYELKSQTPFCFYSKQTGRSIHYYFSESIGSQMFLFTKKNLYRHFDSAMVQAILQNKYYNRKI